MKTLILIHISQIREAFCKDSCYLEGKKGITNYHHFFKQDRQTKWLSLLCVDDCEVQFNSITFFRGDEVSTQKLTNS